MMVIQQVYVTIYKQDTFRYVQTRYDIHEDMVMLYVIGYRVRPEIN